MDVFFKGLVEQKEWISLLWIFILSLIIVSILIPQIIFVSIHKKLFDDPLESRKLHRAMIPNLGGVAIFAGYLFSCLLFVPLFSLPQWGIVIAGGLIIFLVGLKDDMLSLDPLLKLSIQTLAASLVVLLSGLKIDQLQGAGALLTIFFIVGIVNAINLIDGIDGLAALLGIVLTICCALLFYYSNEVEWALISMSLTGALTGFLLFNFSPAKIFMGNSGSYLLGFFISILGIKVINILNVRSIQISFIEIHSGFALILSILIIPVFDTLRIIVIRMSKGKSPLKADRNHIHHRLLLAGLTHAQATLSLVAVDVVIIFLTVCLQGRDELEIVLIILAVITILNGLFSLAMNRKRSLLKKESSFLKSPKYAKGQ